MQRLAVALACGAAVGAALGWFYCQSGRTLPRQVENQDNAGNPRIKPTWFTRGNG